jgi:O-antigen/teichoic acid export membrane protein
VKARGLGANSSLAFVGDAASKVAAFVVLLAAARLFSIDEFAVVATGLACASLLTMALDIGAGTLLARDGALEPGSRGALFRALLVARVPLAVAAVLAGLLLGLVLRDPWTVLMVVSLALSGALTLSVLGLYRSCGDIAPEALERIAAAGLSILTVFAVGLYAPRADVLFGALALATLLPLLPLLAHAPRIADLGLAMSSWHALRRAVPIGVLALLTIAYYRTGTIALALLADPRATASFGVASTLAFGLLLIPNAITTALLPRLAVDRASTRLVATTRRALVWTLVIAVPVSLAAAAIGPTAIPAFFGPEYDDAGLPFMVICLGIPVIAVSGVLGTALLAVGRLRALGAQVVASLIVNVAVLLLLVPSFGAVGASLATLACEVVGLVLLLRAARRVLPDLLRAGPLPVRPRIDVPDSARP